MKSLLKRIFHFDPFVFGSVILIFCIGILSIYSSTGSQAASRQLLFFFTGVFLCLIISFFDWRSFRENSFLVLVIYFFAIALLVGVLFFGPEIRNVRRWFRLGTIMIAPAEFAKLTLIILLAKYFSDRHIELYKVRHIILSGIYAFIPTYLVFRQPDLGTAIIFLVLWGGILLISGIRLRHFIALCIATSLSLGLVWGFVMQDYQRDRVISFIDPQVDPQGIGWGGNHARIAIGNGGFWGQGLKEGSQTQYGFLPEPHTDFIFAAIAEEMGFVAVLLLVGSIALIVWRMLLVIFKSNSNFPRLFVSGFLIMFIFQSFVNMGMNLGILPIMGTPLPFASYGGGSMLLFFAGLGIFESIRYNSN